MEEATEVSTAGGNSGTRSRQEKPLLPLDSYARLLLEKTPQGFPLMNLPVVPGAGTAAQLAQDVDPR